ncbi:MAG: DUF4114 domain-containing protein, partial [Oscillatoria sp. Prado101]|nr:DUF4114 domain-containing protein [Oscillatoria sp. Prado101]
MGWFNFSNRKRPPAQGFQPKTFILEPILTPSGIVDGADDTPDPAILDVDTPAIDGADLAIWSDAEESDIDWDADSDDTEKPAHSPEDVMAASTPDAPVPDDDLEELPFISSVDDVAGDQETAELLVDDLSDGADTNSLEDAVNAAEPVDLGEPVNVNERTHASFRPILSEQTGAGEPADDLTEQAETTLEDGTELLAVSDVPALNSRFDSGVFIVGETGEVGVDFLFDGGGYKGELAIFSLEGMDELELGSQEFIKEAASRALSHSEFGYVVISDPAEGARFSAVLGEPSQNAGEYLGVKAFAMRAGDEFAIMLVPNGKIQQVFDNPAIGGSLRPLFSLGTANPNDAYHVGQIADVTGSGSTFVMEDMRVDGWTDKDYNDIVFQVRGATGKAAHLDEVINPAKDWRSTDMGQALIAYAEPYVTPEPAEDLQLELADLISELEELAENPQPADDIIDPVAEISPAVKDVGAEPADSFLADDLEDALADLIADLEDFTDDLDALGDEVPTATEASAAAEVAAAETDYSQIKQAEYLKDLREFTDVNPQLQAVSEASVADPAEFTLEESSESLAALPEPASEAVAFEANNNLPVDIPEVVDTAAEPAFSESAPPASEAVAFEAN